MRLQDWFELFRRHKEIKILHFQHLAILCGMNRHALRVALRRLVHRKAVQRICRGYYANPFNLPTLEEISAQIYQPSYISLESALCRHGILSQMPYPLTCVTTRLPRAFHTSFGVIRYRQVKREYFFGFFKEAGHSLAEPEKAFVDFLYLNRKEDTRGTVADWNLKGLRLKRLRSYARRMKVTLPAVTERGRGHSGP